MPSGVQIDSGLDIGGDADFWFWCDCSAREAFSTGDKVVLGHLALMTDGPFGHGDFCDAGLPDSI